MQNELANLANSETAPAFDSVPQIDETFKPEPLTSIELARLAMDAAADKKALDVMTLNVGPYLVLVDYFVIATGNTDRHCAAIVDAVEDKLAQEGRRKSHTREGDNRGSWILLDYGDIVVHVFQPQARGEYRLEKLWGEATRLHGPGEKTATFDSQAHDDLFGAQGAVEADEE